MLKRTKTGQAKHDNEVLKKANRYKNRGYKVNADLPGQIKPKTIDGYMPDLIVKKGTQEIIIEVETKDSNITDKDSAEGV